MREFPVMVTESDAHRLHDLLDTHAQGSGRDCQHLRELESELERAVVLAEEDIPSDRITLRSRVVVRDLASGERHEYQLVLPAEADVRSNRISVLAPLGTALLGYRTGDEFTWRMPGGLRRLLVQSVQQQSAPLTTVASSAQLRGGFQSAGAT